jgi:hypothetical protein
MDSDASGDMGFSCCPNCKNGEKEKIRRAEPGTVAVRAEWSSKVETAFDQKAQSDLEVENRAESGKRSGRR